MAWFTRVAWTLAVCSSCGAFASGQELPDKPKMKVEFRWADEKPTKGLTEDKGIDLSCSDKKGYLHREAVLTNADIARTRLVKANAAPDDKYIIEAYLTQEAAKRLARSSKANLKKPLVVLVDGKVAAAMVVMDPLSDFVPITGLFTKAEAGRIVQRIK